MIINKILPSLLQDNGKPVSVSIIDSGFSYIPSYAKIYGYNNILNCQHGDKVLSVFTALDKSYPIKNLTLNLVCYNPKTEYKGLINALKLLPHSDILSISIAWKQHNEQIKKLLFDKANIICVPYSKNGKTPFPSSYNGVITCSYMENCNADYSIHPISQFRGNSFAVPAIARLLAYGHNYIENNSNGVFVSDLFKQHHSNQKNYESNNGIKFKTMRCRGCNNELRDKNHILLREYPESCPYCGIKLK